MAWNPQFEYGGPEKNRKLQPMNERWRQEFGGLRGLREDDSVDEQISERDLEICDTLKITIRMASLVYFMVIILDGSN